MSYLVIGLVGPELSKAEREWLAGEEVGGAILFARNFVDVDQWLALTAAIREIDANAVIWVDQEGGRVQRVREPLTRLPPLGAIGARYDADADDALELAYVHALLMSTEMLALNVDMSLAPVLDLDRGSKVVGDRSFHGDYEVVKELSRAYIKGMHQAGMPACGKHFPGHGSVRPDTHHEAAEDPRDWDRIAESDLRPFTIAIRQGLDAVMMSHVIYPAVDPLPAGFSRHWIEEVLRERLRFEGVVISDDLSMAAAHQAGGMEDRLRAAREAGNDFLLVCRPEDVAETFSTVRKWPAAGSDRREAVRAMGRRQWNEFRDCEDRRTWQQRLSDLQWNPST